MLLLIETDREPAEFVRICARHRCECRVDEQYRVVCPAGHELVEEQLGRRVLVDGLPAEHHMPEWFPAPRGEFPASPQLDLGAAERRDAMPRGVKGRGAGALAALVPAPAKTKAGVIESHAFASNDGSKLRVRLLYTGQAYRVKISQVAKGGSAERVLGMYREEYSTAAAGRAALTQALATVERKHWQPVARVGGRVPQFITDADIPEASA